MPTSKENHDTFTKVLADLDDVELGALAQLLYESLLPQNNKASSSELSTLGKQLWVKAGWKTLVPELKLPVLRSAMYLKSKLPELVKIEAVAVNGAAPAAPASEEETRPETPEAKAEGKSESDNPGSAPS